MIKRILSVLIAVITLISFSSCGKTETKPDEYFSATFFAMDTEVTVRLARDTGKTDEEGKEIYHTDKYLMGIVSECSDIAMKTEALLTRTRDTSVIAELNTESDFFHAVNEEVINLLVTSLDISAKTGGAFDVTVGSAVELWNVTGDTPAVPSDEDVTQALSHIGYSKIEIDGTNLKKLDRMTKIDLGAIGKGYALGKIVEHLKTTDVLYGVVSFGGNVGVFGNKNNGSPYKVGVTDALDNTKVSSYVYIDSGYVSVSGDYERFFTSDGMKYCHIFDPSTGRPAKSDISGVAVLCEDPSLADALSTALFVMGSERALEFYNSKVYEFEAVIQRSDGALTVTDGLKDGGKFEDAREISE